jgi:AbrB family looped-hinge helix DNA binding protein
MATQDEMDITIVSDKGQIVIPAAIRNRFGLKPRSKLLVYGFEDTIVLCFLPVPVTRRRRQGRSVCLKP